MVQKYRQIVEFIFIIKLFGDTTIACIFDKSSQTYGMENKDDNCLGTYNIFIKL